MEKEESLTKGRLLYRLGELEGGMREEEEVLKVKEELIQELRLKCMKMVYPVKVFVRNL